MGRGSSKASGGVVKVEQKSVLSDAKTLSRYIINEREKKQKEEGLNWEQQYKSTKMYTYDIDGKQIKTNYGAVNYPYWNGNEGVNRTRVGLNTTTAEVLKSLIEDGYDTIQFKSLASGQIRGYTTTYAFYSKKKKGG